MVDIMYDILLLQAGQAGEEEGGPHQALEAEGEEEGDRIEARPLKYPPRRRTIPTPWWSIRGATWSCGSVLVASRENCQRRVYRTGRGIEVRDECSFQ
jgi:hypothetical protein